MNESDSSEQSGSVERGHEPDAINARLIKLSGGGFVLLVALGLLVVWGVIRLLTVENQNVSEQPPVTPPTATMAGPQLSADLPRQLHQLREAEEQLLKHYEWIDQQAGIARIPVDRAMEILAKNGLPKANVESEKTDDNTAE